MLSKFPACATLPFDGLRAAETFYTKTLGLKLLSGSAGAGYLELETGKGTTIEIFESDSKKSDDTAVTFDVKDLDEEMKDLRGKGVRFEDYDLPGIKTVNGVATMDGHKGAWFKDPGGNIIALHQSK